MLTHFYSQYEVEHIEKPFGMGNFEERKCPTELPYWAPTGWRLVALVPPSWRSGLDPYILYDRWGNILHVWNQEYPPSYVEVMQVCQLVCQLRKDDTRRHDAGK